MIEISRSGFRGKRFTTKKNEERIRLESKDREAKLRIRSFQRENRVDKTHFDGVLEKSESVVVLRDCLFFELAMHENTLKGLSAGINNMHVRETHMGIKGNLKRITEETAEALRTLV